MSPSRALQTRYWKEVGLSGMQVYKYHLQRRPNQGQLVTQRVVFGGVGAPKSHSALATHGLVDRDLSGGLESVPVSFHTQESLIRCQCR